MKRWILPLTLILLMTITHAGALTETKEASGTLEIQPSPKLFLPGPEGEPPQCDHQYAEPNSVKTVSADLDEYFYCYMDISISGKRCKKCGVTAYALDYTMFPHTGNDKFCRRCQKHLVPPVVVAPLL